MAWLNKVFNNRGAITLQTAAVLPLLLLMLFGTTEMFLYYFDLQVINTALDQSFRQAQLDGYFSDEARQVAEKELAYGFLIKDYELVGTAEQKTWGEQIEITFSTIRTMYITSLWEFTITRQREGYSEYWPGAPAP